MIILNSCGTDLSAVEFRDKPQDLHGLNMLSRPAHSDRCEFKFSRDHALS